jgi:hypothetical protein
MTAKVSPALGYDDFPSAARRKQSGSCRYFGVKEGAAANPFCTWQLVRKLRHRQRMKFRCQEFRICCGDAKEDQ